MFYKIANIRIIYYIYLCGHSLCPWKVRVSNLSMYLVFACYASLGPSSFYYLLLSIFKKVFAHNIYNMNTIGILDQIQ